MIVVTVTHDKTCRILTDDTIGVKSMVMVFIMFVAMIIFIMIIMGWTWCYWACTFQMVLRCLNLLC